MKILSVFKIPSSLATSIFLVMGGLSSLHAQTAVNKANNTTALNVGSSWASGSVPGSTNIATWTSTVTSANTTELGGSLSWAGIDVNNPGGTVTINDTPGTSTLTLGSSGIKLDGTLNRSLTINASVALGAAQTWGVNGDGRTLTVGGVISGSGALTFTQLTGSSASNFVIGNTGASYSGNTYTGTTTINGGATVNVYGANTSTLAVVSTFFGAAPASFVANQLTLDNGTLKLESVATASGTTNVVFSANDGITLGAGGGTFTGSSRQGFTFNSVITGSGSLNIGAGPGAGDSLNAVNTFTGTLFETSNANVSLGVTNALATAAGVNLQGTSILALTTNVNETIGGLTTIAGTAVTYGSSSNTATLTIGQGNGGGTVAGTIGSFSGSSLGSVTKIGTGTLVMAGTAATGYSNYKGTTTLNGGVINLGESEAASTTLSVTTNGTTTVTLASGTTAGLAVGQIVTATGLAGVRIASIVNSTTFTVASAATASGTVSASFADAGALGSGGSIVFGGGKLQYSSANQYDYSSRFSTAAGQQYNIDTNGQSVTYASALTSTGGSLTLSDTLGTGKLILTGNNTWTGGTTISSGTLQVGSGATTGNLGSGGVTDNSALIYDRSNALTESNVITGTGSVSQIGTGTVTLTGSNTWTGGTSISFGALQVGSGGTTGNLGSGGVTDNSALIYDRNNALTESNVITGTGSVSQIGSGTTTFVAANTYTGGTTISAGGIQVGSGGTTGNLGSGGVTDNGTLSYDRSNALTESNVISGTGSVSQIGSGTTTLTSNNTYTGGTEVSSGTLLANGGTATRTGGFVTGTSGSATGTGSVLVDNHATLGGTGVIKPTSGTGVTIATGGTLVSGIYPASGTAAGPGLTLDNTAALPSILNVNSNATLTFYLGSGATKDTYDFANPATQSSFLTVIGNTTGEISFGTGDTINLVDLTGGVLQLTSSTPYLLIQAGGGDALSDNDLYSGLTTSGGYIGTQLQNGWVTDLTVTGLNGVNYPTNSLYLYDGNLEVVPEPSTWALMIGGLALLVVWQRRRNKQA
jgi:fibronectin-binding autotransporter adhesin